MSLRSRLIRLASELPAGDGTRRKLLSALRTANFGLGQMRNKDRKTISTDNVYVHVWFDEGVASDDFGRHVPDSGEWEIITTTSPDPLNMKPRGRELTREYFRFADPKMRSAVERTAEDYIRRILSKYRGRLATDRVADEADVGWATMLKTKKYVDEELAPAENYARQVALLKSLRAGDRVEITYNDSQRGGLVRTQRVVSMSWTDLQEAHPGSFNRPQVLLEAKAAGRLKGGMITDYGSRDGVVWQGTMQMPVRGVENLKRL